MSIYNAIFLFDYTISDFNVFQIFNLLITVLLICLINLYFFQKFIRFQNKQSEVKTLRILEESAKTLPDDQIKQILKFKHDYHNIVIGLEALIDQRNWDELVLYFQNMKKLSAKIQVSSEWQLLLERIHPSSLRFLINRKLQFAEQQNVEIEIICIQEIKINYKNLLSLIRILGILLDNAIESAIAFESSFVNLLFVDTGEYISIIIENSSDTNSINSLISNAYVSTKSSNRGLGLQIVDDITAQSNIELITEFEHNTVRQIIEIPK